MQCQICHKNEATIHLTEISSGKRSEIHICEKCAIRQDISIKSHIPINELLNNLLAAAPSEDEFQDPLDTTTACPNCGMTLTQFSSDGMLGCPYDYEFFEHSLLPLIARSHDGRTSHCGKIPARMPKKIKNQIELFELRRRLQTAVETEDYEHAVQLRDRIKQYENQHE